VGTISAGSVEDYKAWRRTKHGVKEVTLRHDLHSLSKFFRYAIKHAWARVNPVKEVAIPSDKDAARMHILTDAEEKAYFDEARRTGNGKAWRAGDGCLYDVARIILLQGCRPEEVLRLRIEDIDVENGRMKIVKGKSRAARRTLKLTPETRHILGERISRADGSGWVFPGKKPGTNCTKLNGPHDRVCKRTGLSFVIYDLKHTFATRVAEGGMPIATLAAILGHADLRSVMKYVHVRQEAMDKAMDKVGQKLNEVQPMPEQKEQVQ
jgi:integrase